MVRWGWGGRGGPEGMNRKEGLCSMAENEQCEKGH